MDKKEQVFTQLVREHKSTIYSVCYMFSKDKDEIDDLFQEILIRLWKGYNSFRGKSDVRTWIYRVSLNCCLNIDKKRRRGGERVALSVDIDPFKDMDDRALQTKRLYARINRLGLVDRGITKKVKRFKQQYQRYMYISYITAVILVGLYTPTVYHSWNSPEQGAVMVVLLWVIVASMFIWGFFYYKRLMKACDSILNRLQVKEDDLSTNRNMKITLT
jgi:RNA polymerase sigma-70 factor (ECF subfamily)